MAVKQRKIREKITSLFSGRIFVIFFMAFLICGLYFFWISKLEFTERFRLKVLDLSYLLDFKISKTDPACKDIVLVTIDDDSVGKMDFKWPWSRAIMAAVIKNISGYNPEFICLDFAFIGEYADPNQDLILAKAIGDAGNVFLASFFSKEGRYIKPLNILNKKAKASGFVNKPRDLDNASRRLRPWMRAKNGELIDYSLAVKLAAESLSTAPEELLSGFSYLPNDTIYGKFFINDETVSKVPAWKVLKGEVDSAYLTGKKIFVGVTTEVVHDIYPTPIGRLSGVGILINETLLYLTQGSFLYAGEYINFIILYLLIVVFLFSAFNLPASGGVILSLLELFLFSVSSFLLFRLNVLIDYGGILLVAFSVIVIFYLYRYIGILAENSILRRQALKDGLTDLYVYRYFQARLKRDFNLARQNRTPLSLIIIDIDHFKRVNDEFGHEFGNRVIKLAAEVFKKNTRGRNLISRYGGDEFCVLLGNADKKEALGYSERIVRLAKEEFSQKLNIPKSKAKKISITCSAGVASFENRNFDSYQELFKAADSALYRSKETGRNKVSLFVGGG